MDVTGAVTGDVTDDACVVDDSAENRAPTFDTSANKCGARKSTRSSAKNATERAAAVAAAATISLAPEGGREGGRVASGRAIRLAMGMRTRTASRTGV